MSTTFTRCAFRTAFRSLQPPVSDATTSSRCILQPVLSAGGAQILPRGPSRRSLHTVLAQQAQYKRFGDRQPSKENDLFNQIQQRGPYRQPVYITPYSGQGGRGGQQARQDNRRGVYIIAGVTVFAGAYYIVHLEQVPETGRWRFMDTSVLQERQMGDQAFQQIVSQYRSKILPSYSPRARYVRRVAERIVAAVIAQQEAGKVSGQHLQSGMYSGMERGMSNDEDVPIIASKGDGPPPQWQVFVIDSPEVNAFVLPNGKIFVFTGILPICQDEDGLATVIGHEVAHQIARHGAERMSYGKVLMFVTYALDALLLSTIGTSLGFSASLTQILLGLPNSRKTETEADHIGLRIMSAACFDPMKAPDLWKRMQAYEKKQGKGSTPEALQTHPLSEKRMKNLQDWLSEAEKIRAQNNCPSQTNVQGFFQGNPIRSAGVSTEWRRDR